MNKQWIGSRGKLIYQVFRYGYRVQVCEFNIYGILEAWSKEQQRVHADEKGHGGEEVEEHEKPEKSKFWASH